MGSLTFLHIQARCRIPRHTLPVHHQITAHPALFRAKHNRAIRIYHLSRPTIRAGMMLWGNRHIPVAPDMVDLHNRPTQVGRAVRVNRLTLVVHRSTVRHHLMLWMMQATAISRLLWVASPCPLRKVVVCLQAHLHTQDSEIRIATQVQDQVSLRPFRPPIRISRDFCTKCTQ